MYTEIDYFYDGILCCVVCVGCIDKYKFDNADYTNFDLIDGVKYWEGEPLTCECCGKLIHSEYGGVE